MNRVITRILDCRLHGSAVRSAVVVLILAALGGCGTPASVETGAPLEAFVAHLEGSVPRQMRTYGVPGVAIALIRNGETAWTGAFGFADVEQGRPMTTDAVFHTGSISKSVSAWGAMRLVEDGQVDLDDPIAMHVVRWQLPTSAYQIEDVTVRRALSHTTGAAQGPIGNEFAPWAGVPPLDDALTQELRLVEEPGARFTYSNPGFDLVEILIEDVSGRTFAAFMDAEVLAPLGMHDASFEWHDALRSRLPTGYDLRGAPVGPYVYATKASGGLFATVEDVARFVAASVSGPNEGGAVLSEASLGVLHAPHVEIPGVFGVVADAYGLGHFVESLPDGREAVWHGGQGNGWMTHFHAVPVAGDGIVILTNSQRSWPLMAQTLSAWARWTGAGTVKMARIRFGVAAARIIVAVLAIASASFALSLARSVVGGRRSFAPLARTSRSSRSLQATVGVAGVVALLWSAAQPYLLVSSVFPGVVEWVFWSSLLLCCLLIVGAAFPTTRSRRT